MLRKYLVLALLIAGLVGFAPRVGAVSPDPDNAAGIDLHSNTVVNGLVTGVSDITSGNTVQVGPVGGIFGGGVSVVSGGTSAAAYTGACILVGVNYLPNSGDAIVNGSTSTQARSVAAVVTGIEIDISKGTEYIELYDGTARGDLTSCKADVKGATANTTGSYNGPPLNFAGAVYVHASNPTTTWRIAYENQDYLEIYDGTSRGDTSNCLMDLKGSVVDGSISYNGPPIEIATAIYAYNSNANSTWQIQYRIEDQIE